MRVPRGGWGFGTGPPRRALEAAERRRRPALAAATERGAPLQVALGIDEVAVAGDVAVLAADDQ